MQPEEIIQQKEWQQLTATEKGMVTSLAYTEGEYNMLKKMLLILQEDDAEIPPVSLSVKEQLRTRLKKQEPRKQRMLWLAAAACLVIIAFAVFFLLQTKQQNEMANNPNTTKPIQQKTLDSQKTEPSRIIINPVNNPIDIVKQKAVKPRAAKRVATPDPVSGQRNVAITTTVSDNKALLSFVTEVY